MVSMITYNQIILLPESIIPCGVSDLIDSNGDAYDNKTLNLDGETDGDGRCASGDGDDGAERHDSVLCLSLVHERWFQIRKLLW